MCVCVSPSRFDEITSYINEVGGDAATKKKMMGMVSREPSERQIQQFLTERKLGDDNFEKKKLIGKGGFGEVHTPLLGDGMAMEMEMG